jgi:hypothetical protein
MGKEDNKTLPFCGSYLVVTIDRLFPAHGQVFRVFSLGKEH